MHKKINIRVSGKKIATENVPHYMETFYRFNYTSLEIELTKQKQTLPTPESTRIEVVVCVTFAIHSAEPLETGV